MTERYRGGFLCKFLERYRSNGYAIESAQAVMRDALETHGLKRVVAIVTPDNHSSIRLLEKIGLKFERMIRLSEDDEELKFFASDAR